ncbi:hypothetical protein Tco_1551468 [Tanacetum coccineum]
MHPASHRTLHCQVSNLQQDRSSDQELQNQKTGYWKQPTTRPQESTLRDKLASVHFRISTIETTPEDIQVATSYMKDLLKHTS